MDGTSPLNTQTIEASGWFDPEDGARPSESVGSPQDFVAEQRKFYLSVQAKFCLSLGIAVLSTTMGN